MNNSEVPKVSVILPVYNPLPQHFDECIRSVLNQSFEDYEIIISDDSPGNEISQLIGQFSSGKIKYRRNPGPQGIFPNLNHALTCACGEYYQIFCQDDRMYPDYLAGQLRALEKYPDAAFVYAQYDVIDMWGHTKVPCAYPGTRGTPDMYVPQAKAVNCFFKYGCLPGNLSTVMMRRRLYEELGPFDVKSTFAGDFKYWVDTILRFGIAINLIPLLAVRSHNQQASMTLGAAKWIADAVPLYDTLLHHLSIRKSRLYAKLFINERFGTQSLFAFLKMAIKSKDPAKLKYLAILNRSPLNLPLIIMLFIVTMRQSIKLFTLDEVQLFEK